MGNLICCNSIMTTTIKGNQICIRCGYNTEKFFEELVEEDKRLNLFEYFDKFEKKVTKLKE